MPKSTRANKAKGRIFQNFIAKELMEVVPGRLKGQLMGQSGTDIIDLDHVLPWDYTEVKHWQNYPSLSALVSLSSPQKGNQVFFVKANRSPTLVVLELSLFKKLLVVLKQGQHRPTKVKL